MSASLQWDSWLNIVKSIGLPTRSTCSRCAEFELSVAPSTPVSSNLDIYKIGIWKQKVICKSDQLCHCRSGDYLVHQESG